MNKKPLTNCEQNQYINIRVQDSDKKFVKNVSRKVGREENEESNILDFSSFHLELEIDDKFKGGVYHLNLDEQDQIKIFILEFDNRELAVIPSWSVSTIKAGDFIIGNLKLKSFTRNIT